MTVVYPIGDKLYVNLTNKCPCACKFCLRANGPGIAGSGSLWLEREPTTGEVIDGFKRFDLSKCREIVFCGYGEPTERLDALLEVAGWIKTNHPEIPVRVNTNGLSDLINAKPTAGLFRGKVDTVSISLNTDDPDEYLEICRPKFGREAYPALLRFAKEASQCVPETVMTVVGEPVTPKDKQERCRKICEESGAKLRIRPFEPATKKSDAFFASLPYAVWMALMFLFSGAAAYAFRSGAVFLALLVSAVFLMRKNGKPAMPSLATTATGIVSGLAVAVLWIAPEYSAWYGKYLIIGNPAAGGPSPYDPENCGWPLTIARLAGSSFVISVAEELFFRYFLYRRLQREDWRSDTLRKFDAAAFLWTVLLFSLEHNRIVAAAAAGAIYTLVYIRSGFFAATLSHATTNLALSIYVIAAKAWHFW